MGFLDYPGLQRFKGKNDGIYLRNDADQEASYDQRVMWLRNLGIQEHQTAMRFGFKREKANSSCAGRITYLYDAQGFSPAGMTFDSETGVGTFSYGDWEDFCNAVARPVMLKNDGTVDYELDHEDQTKKLDGSASDVADSSYAGNAMVEFGNAFKWVKRYEDANYEYVIFCNIQWDETYHAYAHTNDAGEIKDAFYIGMWAGPYVDSKLRSIGSGGAVAVSQTAEVEITRAKANGSGYYILYKSAWDYINDLLTLISKTDDSQAAFGRGVGASNTRQTAGVLKDVGPFYGKTGDATSVKVFWIVDWWGNMWQRLAGCINDNGNVKCKMTGPYCDTPVSAADYTGYVSSGVTPSGTSGNLTKASQTTDECGYLGKTAQGAANTYIPDSLYFNNGQLDFAFVGAGYDTAADRAGARCLYLSFLASAAYVSIGSRLSYKPV